MYSIPFLVPCFSMYLSIFPMGIEGPLPPQCHPRRKSPANLSTGHVAGLGHHRHHGTQKHLVAVCWAWWDLTTMGKIKTKQTRNLKSIGYTVYIYTYMCILYTYLIYVYDMIWCNISCFQYEPWNKHSHSHGHKRFPRWSWASVWGTESLSISCHKMRAPGNFNPWGEHDR